MKAADVISVIEEFAPLSIQESWDNSGLQTGSPDQEIHGVMLGFDCTPELVREAVGCGCDMVITHHPLLFGGIRRVIPGDPVSDALTEALRGGVAVYAAHTTADKVIGGVSGTLAGRLSLEAVELLDPDGLGVVGNLSAPMSCKDFLAFVKERLGLGVIRHSKPLDIPVKRVAMCGGSGSSLISAAVSSGAQVYLSGDISYHHFHTPCGLMIADVGHFESEVAIVDVLCSLLRKKFPTFAVRISENISNPIYYF